MGHITRSGKADLRGMLVEAAWILVRKDLYFNLSWAIRNKKSSQPWKKCVIFQWLTQKHSQNLTQPNR